MQIEKKTKAEKMLEEKLKQERIEPQTSEKKKYFSKIRNAIGKRAKKVKK